LRVDVRDRFETIGCETIRKKEEERNHDATGDRTLGVLG
jgi:hypothetical protein